jgi:hypothetical protein
MKDNIKMDLKGTEWKGMEMIHLVQDKNNFRAVVNTKINFWVPYNAGNSLTSIRNY